MEDNIEQRIMKMKQMKKFIYLILLLMTSFGFAQEPAVKASIDTTKIRIGEQFQYKIIVNDTDHVIIPKLKNLGKLEVISEGKTDTLKNKLIKKYVLTGFDSGAYYIPRQQIYIKNKVYLTDSLLVNVATVPIDTTKVKKYPIKAILDEPYTFDDFKPHLWWILTILGIIAIILYFVFKKKKEEKPEEIIPVIPPYEEAIQKLHQLDSKLLWQNNKVKEYYSELTDIVRGYIERELHIPALESTTDELIDMLTEIYQKKEIETTKETIKKLKALLQEADLVKFAKSKPMAAEIEEDRKDAEEVVNHLKPKVVITEKEEDHEVE